MALCLRCVAIWLIAAAFTSNADGSESDLVQRFRKEYPGASQRLEEFYGKTCMDLEFVRKRDDGDERHELRYRSNDGCYRIDFTSRDQERASWVASREYAFLAQSQGGAYRLASMSSKDRSAKTLRTKFRFPFVIYSILEVKISDLVKLSGFRIITAEEKTFKEGKLLSIGWEWSMNDDKGKPQTRVGWVII